MACGSWTTKQLILAFAMVLTGSINTLSTKWADKQVSEGSDGVKKNFIHPFVQSCGMFLGEFSCFIVFKLMVAIYKYKGKPLDIGEQKFSPFIFLPPALCDMTATSIMYMGLNLTYASSFQMLRGAIIIFTGLLSVAFLGRFMKNRQWLGIFFVIIGLTVVGTSDLVGGKSSPDNTHSTNSLITGDLLIVIAQIIGATQMVVEEKFVTKYNVPPLQAVGWEGFFGFTTLSVLLIPMYFIHVGPMFSSSPGNRLEDPVDALTQLGNNYILLIAQLGNVISIAFFNFSGISVTKEISATTRMVLDSVRTLVIWVFALAVSWQDFQYLQPIGFLLLVFGMAVYEGIINRSCFSCRSSELEPVVGDENKSLLQNDSSVQNESKYGTNSNALYE